MDDEIRPEDTTTTDDVPTTPHEDTEVEAPTPEAFVRQQAPRRTVDPVDDLAEDDAEAAIQYQNDSAYTTTSFAPLSGDGVYRHSRKDLQKLQEGGNRYGQYLEIPKGHHSIFARNERKRRIHSIVAAVVVLIVLVLVAFLLWELIGA